MMDEHKLIEKIIGQLEDLAEEFNQLADLMARLQDWKPTELRPNGTKTRDITNTTLDRIEKWKIRNHQDCLELLCFCRTAWFCHDYVRVSEDKTRYQFYTGASRTNEDIVKAMQANTIFWNLVWYSSQRGGHYVMVIPS